MEDCESAQTALESLQVNPAVVYMLSSKVGLGHSTRAVAIAHELAGQVEFSFATQPAVRDFISGNLDTTNSLYEFVDLDYEPEIEAADFLLRNRELLGTLALRSQVVLNDFVLQAVHLRDAPEFALKNKQMVGIYHTIEACRATSPQTQEYIDKYMRVARCMDHIFLAETEPSRRSPYQLDSGTRVVPCEPVVRRVTRDSSEIKAELGMEVDDEFILVQGGMQGNTQLRQLLRSARYLTGGDKRVVLAPFNMRHDPKLLEDTDVICLDKRMDGHNVVAAASGVISKPGMQTLCETIAYRVPVLFVDDRDPERQLKLTMIDKILDSSLPYILDVDQPLEPQVSHWIESADKIRDRFEEIPCNGAAQIAEEVKNMM